MAIKSRGKHPNDEKLFGEKWLSIFKAASTDLSYLLSREYGIKSAVQIVGNRYRMNSRQQIALKRMCASQKAVEIRQEKEVKKDEIEGQKLLIDGFNLLILLENALSKAYIFRSQDGTYRDNSSVHGTYKRVLQTEEAILLVGNILKKLKAKEIIWYFDAPVSNSGRLKSILSQMAIDNEFDWVIYLDNNPDKVLIESQEIVVTSDAWILDECKKWFNLGALIVEEYLTDSEVFDVFS